jgi:hypothetical protein
VSGALLIDSEGTSREVAAGAGLATAALQLSALLRNQQSPLSQPETALLLHWLRALASSEPVESSQSQGKTA